MCIRDRFLIMVLIEDLCELFSELREFACLDLFFADWIFAIEGDDEDIFALCQLSILIFIYKSIL